MNFWGWLKSDGEPPDAWTPDRERRVLLIAQFHGDVETARRVWEDKTRKGFARYLLRTSRIGADDREAAL